MVWTPEAAIRDELQPNESIRWLGTPSFFPMLWTQTFSIGFGIVFAGIPLSGGIKAAGDYVATGDKSKLITALITGVFVLIGCGIVLFALWTVLSVWRTAYAVTNRRILIVTNFVTRRILAIAPGGINAIEWNVRGNNSGSVTFRRETSTDSEGTTTTNLKFVGVRDVRGAVKEIEKLRNDANQTGQS